MYIQRDILIASGREVLTDLDGEEERELIHNSSISMEQPSDFDLENSRMNSEPYIGATIIEKDGKHLLRLISLLREEGEQTVRCVEASYQEDGWFIENVEIYENYYTDKLCRTLLKNNY